MGAPAALWYISPMRRAFLACLSLSTLAASCSDGTKNTPDGGDASTCSSTFAAPTSDGHADPTGAKAAKQARAGRIKDAGAIRQPADARQKVRVGDFLLTNDKVAMAIEDKGVSDGYARFGGEVLAVDRVGDDGKMLGQSRFGETLAGLAGEMIDPDGVGVLADGSDGGEAIVRVVGTLKTVPFLQVFKAALGSYGWPAMMDYRLAPGEEVVRIRVTVLNTGDEDRQALGLGGAMHGFFHTSRMPLFMPEAGFGDPSDASWVGFESAGETSFAWRASPSAKLKYGLGVSGFALFTGPQVDVARCEEKKFDYAEVIIGGPGLDGLREAVRRTDKAPAWREVKGTVTDGFGAPVPGAIVAALAMDGSLLTRTTADAMGAFAVHLPSESVTLVPVSRGYPAGPTTTVGPSDTTASPTFGKHATVVVHAREKGTGRKVPARVQIIPDVAQPATPAQIGVLDEEKGRLWQEFAITGDATLPVPPGKHRVVVSHGYEWELVDTSVSVAAGETQTVDADLVHSVDSTNVMCADFHVHSFYSADSDDPVVYKVKGAVSDGLDVPVSSEHEWIVDFGPVVKQLGLDDWALGMSSEELTTFTWGHFGVVPLDPKPDQLNNGAIEWIGKQPSEMFASVHAQAEKPVLIVNHPRSGSLGSFQAYFDAAGWDRATNKGNALWSDDFQAIEVTNGSDFEANRKAVVQDWFAMLELGRPMVAVGSSDSHHLRSSPVGYPRTCLKVGTDDPKALTPVAVRDALGAAKAVISGGLSMTVVGPNGEGPGQTVPAGSGPIPFKVTVSAPSWVPLDPKVEVIVHGKTVATVALADEAPAVGKRWSATIPVDRGAGKGWVVFHAKGAGDLAPLHPGYAPFAVSNAVFFQ